MIYNPLVLSIRRLIQSAMSTAAGMFSFAMIASPAYAVAADAAGVNTLSTAASAAARQRTSDDPAIRPFRIDIPQSALDDLRRRVAATQLPDKEVVGDFSQGVPLRTIQQLKQHWETKYDWRRVEAKMNSYPQFLTEIDGVDIHFIHARSKHANALPVIITHGWPGSVVEQLKIIEPLTDPTAHGGKAADAFDVVIPNMPGYGFSGKPTDTGWGPDRIARAYDVLMKRLGYTRYVAQGGDWGAVVVDLMAVQKPEGLLGIHTNMAGVVPPELDKLAVAGAPAPSGLSTEEKRAYEQLVFTYKNVQYAYLMGSRPQTLYGIADSPVGLAAWLLDHDPLSLELIARSFAGVREGLTPDDVLDNVTLFWLTNTGVSASRLYWENKFNYFSPKGVTLPVAVSAFPDELYTAPRSWAEKAYPNLVYYNNAHPRGGHFAAWEQPASLVGDMRAGFKSLRKDVLASN